MTTTTGKDIFAGHRLRDEREIEVAQIGWDSILVSADSPCKLPGTPFLVHGRTDGVQQGRTIKPDFVLVRNEVRRHSVDSIVLDASIGQIH